MIAHRFAFDNLILLLLLAFIVTISLGEVRAQSTVLVEEIDVSKAKDESSAQQAWDKTKQATSSAAEATVEFTKEHGTRAVNATKKGVTKGAVVVAEQSKKAWEATKTATGKAVEFTAETASKAGQAISNKLSKGDQVPVTEQSVDAESSNGL